jgi:hypothetical protein
VSPIDLNLPSLRGQFAAYSRSVQNGERAPDDPEYLRVRLALKFGTIAAFLERQLSDPPALTDARRVELADLLRPACPARTSPPLNHPPDGTDTPTTPPVAR